jgi:hypothetical protein
MTETSCRWFSGVVGYVVFLWFGNRIMLFVFIWNTGVCGDDWVGGRFPINIELDAVITAYYGDVQEI